MKFFNFASNQDFLAQFVKKLRMYVYNLAVPIILHTLSFTVVVVVAVIMVVVVLVVVNIVFISLL